MLHQGVTIRWEPRYWLQLACVLMSAGSTAWAQSPRVERVAHNTDEFWKMVSENPDSDLSYDMECDVLYYNTTWKIMWVQSGSRGEYANPGVNPHPVQSGARARFRGTLRAPVYDLNFSEAVVERVGEAKSKPRVLHLGEVDLNAFRNELVSLEAWVDKQDRIDDGFLRLSLSHEGRAVFAMVTLGDEGVARALVDRRVRITGVFAPSMDPSGGMAELQVMVPHVDDIEILGFVADDPRFDAPFRLIDELPAVQNGEEVRLMGEVVQHNVGRSITVRDRSGQIELKAQQVRYVNPGETIELVARVARRDERTTLDKVSFRRPSARTAGPTRSASANRDLLNLAARVRELPEDEVSAGHIATLRGVVTWSHPDSNTFYLADSSGGVEVLRSPDAPLYAPGTMLDVRGPVAAGAFAPIVHASELFLLGAMSYPTPEAIGLEMALSGIHDAQWVSMQGYVFAISRENEINTLNVSTNQGDFKINVPAKSHLLELKHTLIEAHGVCVTHANGNRQLEQIELMVPEEALVTVLESAPSDPFTQTELPMQRLGRFNPIHEGTHLVNVTGTVLVHQADHWLYLADDDRVLRVHTRDPVLQPSGRRLEVAGRLGREQGKTVLREALLRPMGAGTLPEVKHVNTATDDLSELEGHLIAVTGTLINRLATPDHLRLTVQNQGMVIDADLLDPTLEISNLTLPEVGAEIQLSGVLVPALGTAGGASGGFSIHLGSANDIVVLTAAPWWSPRRQATLAGTLLLAVGLSILWVRSLRRRVQQQTALITEQLERESRMSEQLQHATRLESLGLLAGGIAHDFNNLLTVVLGNLSLLRLDTPRDSEADHSLSEAEGAVSRARQLTMQLLTFAKGGSPVRTAEDLPGIIREVAKFSTHGSNVNCNLVLAKNAWTAHVDKGQIGQVVQNLVINALQAMPDGGELTLRLANETSPDELPATLDPGRYLRLDIVDTGCGITPENLPRIFDPYFSTKTDGHGLGLATVYSIVRKHLGDITVHSVEGRGTTFRIWLPATEDTTPPVAPSLAQSTPRGNGESILVMDDEADIRSLGMKMLRQLGYQATGVAHGDEAIEAFAAAHSTATPFAAVILDLTIRGGKGGTATLRELREIDPTIKAIVSSGYSSDKTLAAPDRDGFDDRIPKPYELQHFAHVLHRVLTEQTAVA